MLSTLRGDILPALDGPAHAVALQLSGLARYALDRGPDPTPGRARRLAPLVGLDRASRWPEVAAAAGDLLVAARASAGAALAGGAAAEGAADRVREELGDFVDEDLATSAPLLETFARHGVSLVGEAATPPGEADALAKWFAERLGEPVDHVDVRLMSGGHSRRMLDVTVVTDAARATNPADVTRPDRRPHQHRFVVRVEQGGVFGTEGTSEAAVMATLGAAGVPVAPVRWVETSALVLGHPFFVMDRLDGDHEVDDVSLTRFARALADLHRVPVDTVAAAFPVRPADPAAGVQAAIDHWYGVYRSASPARLPLLDDAAAWLRTNLQPTGPLCVVHGDPGPGNFMHRSGRLVAFTDWEFAHLGDAAEDWVYLGAMRGLRVMGTDDWARWLRDRVGVAYDPSTWRAWTVFNLFKGACANVTALRVFTDGTSLGPNLLAVGTALHLRMVKQLTSMIAAG